MSSFVLRIYSVSGTYQWLCALEASVIHFNIKDVNTCAVQFLFWQFHLSIFQLVGNMHFQCMKNEERKRPVDLSSATVESVWNWRHIQYVNEKAVCKFKPGPRMNFLVRIHYNSYLYVVRFSNSHNCTVQKDAFVQIIQNAPQFQCEKNRMNRWQRMWTHDNWMTGTNSENIPQENKQYNKLLEN